MPLYIRDDSVDQLAREVQRLTGAPSKTEAVRKALEREISHAQEKKTFRERIKRAQDIAAAIGERDPHFDMKTFTDEGWGDV